MTELVTDFINLFGGYQDFAAGFGTGRGGWIKRPLRHNDVLAHLSGDTRSLIPASSGIGLPPLRHDSTVVFCAIDLDEPDFEAARDMQTYLPGRTWVERSRSGNAHVWAFFKEPLEAWVARGIMLEAVEAAGKAGVEVFPKNHDAKRVRLGNYINLPYHGTSRPVLCGATAPSTAGCARHARGAGGQAICVCNQELSATEFVCEATEHRTDPEEWRKRARWLLIEPPDARERNAEHGTNPLLHRCATYIVEHADEHPVVAGHRAAVYFALAKMFTNCSLFDHDEALEQLRSVNEASPDTIPDTELRRILGNAERGRFTSTGCDDPLVKPYADPACPIANPRSNQ